MGTINGKKVSFMFCVHIYRFFHCIATNRTIFIKLRNILASVFMKEYMNNPVSYTHLTLPTIYSV